MVEFRDEDREALVFDQTEADAVTDRHNSAAEHPDVIRKVRAYVEEHGGGRRFLAVADDIE